jgi:7-dehydrocholesterol reductase
LVAGDGEEKVSLLLASGWWGVARHFHYVPEVLASCCWTLPAMFNHLLPWTYSIFLTLLLLDRLFRDDTRCKAKYGRHWDEYCRVVPYRLIPFIL